MSPNTSTRPPLAAGSQGDIQTLENGNVFIGWGAEPYFSEFSASGQLLYDAHMHGTYQSYRTYRFAWTGAPSDAPAIAATKTAAQMTVYASWNGDTRTASWQVLAGPTAAAAHAGGQRRAHRLRDGYRGACRRGLRGRAGARRSGRSARHLAHDRRLSAQPSRATVRCQAVPCSGQFRGVCRAHFGAL